MKKFILMAAAAMMMSCGGNQANQPQNDNNEAPAASQAAEVKKDDNAAKQAALDAKVAERLKEFYTKYVFGGEELTDALANEFCTKKLVKKLADDYEYEGGGYAVWDFRNPGNDTPESKVSDVKPLGNGKYQVVMDHNATSVVSVVVENDKILFDDVDNSGAIK